LLAATADPGLAVEVNAGGIEMTARPCVTPARDRIKSEFDHELEANIRGGLRRMRRTG